MDEYDHLTDAHWDLYDRMSGISVDCLCAAWIGGNEYDIWEALQHGDTSPAHRRMSPRLLRLCQRLSAEVDGWIYWADGPQFAPMAQWLTMVEKRRNPVSASDGARAVTPAEIRQSMGLKEGDAVLTARLAQMREAQAMVRQDVPAGVSLVDELIADRRAENAQDKAT